MRVTAELWTGRDTDGKDSYVALSEEEKNGLVSDMTFRLTVSAVDPENEGISYSYASNYGTFSPLAVTEAGTTAFFLTGGEDFKAGAAVTVTVTATDPVGDSMSAEITLGRVKTLPELIVSLSPSAQVLSGTLALGGTLSLYISADCTGQYQVHILPAGSTMPSLDYTDFVWPYRDKGVISQVSVPTSGEIKTAGKYDVWVVLADALWQEDAEHVTINVN